ncbi:MAG: hypothetical protein RSE12_07000 [Fuscovulum sp.]|nr:MAG: hypothetical protein RSE12_07000 [Fuscovulum sp.]
MSFDEALFRTVYANDLYSFLRRAFEGLRLLRDALPPYVSHPRKFDLLIIDEAHNVAPTVGRYAVESLSAVQTSVSGAKNLSHWASGSAIASHRGLPKRLTKLLKPSETTIATRRELHRLHS